HATFTLGARKCRSIGLDAGLSLLHPIGRGHAAGEFGKDLAEHALAAIAVDDALVVHEVGRGLGEGALRDAGGSRLLFEIGEEAIEVGAIMTGGGAGRGGSGWSSWRCNRWGRWRLWSAPKCAQGRAEAE